MKHLLKEKESILKSIMENRFKHKSMQLSDTSQIGKLRKDKARISTVINERKIIEKLKLTRKITKMDSNRTRRTGKVISDTPDKTIIVGVSWSQKDRLYKKSTRRLTKLVAHDPKEEAKVGDNVIVEFSKPISKTKKWKLVEVIN